MLILLSLILGALTTACLIPPSTWTVPGAARGSGRSTFRARPLRWPPADIGQQYRPRPFLILIIVILICVVTHRDTYIANLIDLLGVLLGGPTVVIGAQQLLCTDRY